MQQDQPEENDISRKTTGRLCGTVRKFDERKGWGFLTRADGGGEVFVHYTAIDGSGFRTLSVGQLVTFAVVQSRTGPKAADVKLVRA